MQTDVITLRKQAWKIDKTNAAGFSVFQIRLLIEGQNCCFKPFQSLGNTASDAPEANQSYCFPVQLGDGLHRPVARPHELPKFTQTSCYGQHQGDSVISYG